jgi:LacI family transcriptional regulator
VSLSTASRALNGRGELSAATRSAVVEAAAALDFRPSVPARSLRMRTTFTVGFVVPDVSSPFYAAALQGAQQRLEAAGYRVMLMDSAQEVARETAALATLVNHRVDGLLLATTGLSAEAFDDAIARSNAPCIFFDSIVAGRGAGAVELDNHMGVELLVDHLLGHGHRRIALLAGSQTETSGVERRDAYRAAMAAHELKVPLGYERVCRWSSESARAATHALLDQADPPTAIIASSAELALGCLIACRERGVTLPDELALVGFDDPYFGDLLEPSLTAIGYIAHDVGEAAASLLVEAMTGDLDEFRCVRVPVELVRRRSCGCPEAQR